MKKLQTQLFFCFFSVSLLVMVSLLLTFYLHIRRQAEEDLAYAHQEIVEHTATSIDSMTNMLLFALSDGPFQRQFKEVLNEDMDKDPYEELQFQKEVAEMFANYSDTYQNLQVSYYVTLYGFNGFRYCSMDHFDFQEFLSSDFYAAVLAADGQAVWSNTAEDPYLPTSTKNVFAVGRAIKSGKNYTASGVLAVIIDEDSLFRIYRSNTDREKSRFFIVSDDGKIMSSEEKENIGTVWDAPIDLFSEKDQSLQTVANENGTDILYSLHRLSSSGWWLVEAFPFNLFRLSGGRFFQAMGLGVLLCFSFSIGLSWFLSRKISLPIKRLNAGMDQIAKGHFDQDLPDYSIEEFNTLIHGFNRMSENIQQLIAKVQQTEEEKNAATIRLLQLQISPHFIYNTLNSIRCMILMGENKDAAQIMVRVILMMRSVLATDKFFITLQDELQNVENYLEIEKSIYYNELTWEWNIAPNARRIAVPRLILQPLVENSIFHGIMPYNIRGKIWIRAWCDDSLLHIIIEDNGKLDSRKRAELAEKLAQGFEFPDSSRPHIGLYNTNKRIRCIYGPEYGIALLPDSEKTAFHLWFPAIADHVPEILYSGIARMNK
ncbi:MAG TPA: histidine kinase [Candidatus Limivivens intestinipullorum]|uniref:Histidine kinase n=1 Tax=Candidatus Limivivens intestinipullorum TaxID=2840858 RepID=A0A9D1EQP3_9FIRM|nr:histidine kinase [Candidatus Limivivens intestinipullorum]